MELFSVEVLSCTKLSAELRLRFVHPDQVNFPLGLSFAMMLVQDEAAPGYARLREWKDAVARADEEFEYFDHVTTVEIIDVCMAPRNEAFAVYRITVDVEGMLGHLEPGQTFGSTAYDEDGKSTFYENDGDPRKCEAAAQPKPRKADKSGFRTVERGADWVVFDVLSLGELPPPHPSAWLETLRFTGCGLDRVRAEEATRYLRRVRVESVGGPRTESPRKLEILSTEGGFMLRAEGAIEARFRLEVANRAWFDAATFMPVWQMASFPEATLMPPPRASSPADVPAFLELLELAQREGEASELAILAEGLMGTRDVVMEALGRVAARGKRAASLAEQLVGLIGSVDDAIAVAALETAGKIEAGSLSGDVRLATRRSSSAVSEAAARVLPSVLA